MTTSAAVRFWGCITSCSVWTSQAANLFGYVMACVWLLLAVLIYFDEQQKDRADIVRQMTKMLKS